MFVATETTLQNDPFKRGRVALHFKHGIFVGTKKSELFLFVSNCAKASRLPCEKCLTRSPPHIGRIHEPLTAYYKPVVGSCLRRQAPRLHKRSNRVSTRFWIASIVVVPSFEKTVSAAIRSEAESIFRGSPECSEIADSA